MTNKIDCGSIYDTLAFTVDGYLVKEMARHLGF